MIVSPAISGSGNEFWPWYSKNPLHGNRTDDQYADAVIIWRYFRAFIPVTPVTLVTSGETLGRLYRYTSTLAQLLDVYTGGSGGT